MFHKSGFNLIETSCIHRGTFPHINIDGVEKEAEMSMLYGPFGRPNGTNIEPYRVDGKKRNIILSLFCNENGPGMRQFVLLLILLYMETEKEDFSVLWNCEVK